jgi:hypothetical protein
MKVYHGSYTEIDEIDLSKCEIGRDFGQGFHVTKLREQAEIWAQRKGLYNNTASVITEFEFNENAFFHFHLKTLRFDGYNDSWLDFVVMNRNTALPQPTHDYDIVEGPVADDKIATRIFDFLKGTVSREQFLKELRFAKDTHQICFCTGRALQMIDRTDAKNYLEYSIIKTGELLFEQLVLDTDMDEEKAANAFYSSQTFARLSDESTGLYQKPWQEIYEMLKKELNM